MKRPQKVAVFAAVIGYLVVFAAGTSWAQRAAIEDITEAQGEASREPSQRQGVARGETGTAATSLEDRVRRLERLMNNQALVDMLRRLEEVQQETELLRGDMEELGHSLDGLKNRQRDIYVDIDRRIQQLETRGASAPSVGTGQTSATGAAVGSAAISSGRGDEDAGAARKAYEKAFGILRQGRYDQAVTAFEQFLKDHPQSDYVDNARYWLGEANYVTRRFERAVSDFKRLIAEYPASPKVADAYLKMGFSYYEMGNWREAREALDKVKQQHPTTAAARLATERLARMKKEGH